MERIDVLGMSFHRVTMEQALAEVGRFISVDKPHLIVTANPETVMLARGDQLLAEIVSRADLVVADGIGVVWAGGVLGSGLPERIPGIELSEGILALAAQEGWPVFLLGGKEGVAEQAKAALLSRFSGLRVVGTHHGYFGAGPEEEALITRIEACRPKVLLAALGVPRQEKWLAARLAVLKIPVAIGVGGSFDVWAGVEKRAPQWMRRMHLEWFYRLLRQPARIKRMLALPRFMAQVFLAKVSRGR